MKKIRVSIDERGRNVRGYRAFVRKAAEQVLQKLAIPYPCELSVLITDDETIGELNSRYRGVERPTDVLAFPMGEGHRMSTPPEDMANLLMGDVVISIETAIRQAAENHQSIEDEIALLITHGILHLMGYDDETEKELTVMRRATDEILRTIDIEALRKK